MKKLLAIFLCFCLLIPAVGVTPIQTKAADNGFFAVPIPYRADVYAGGNKTDFLQATTFDPINIAEYGYPTDGSKIQGGKLGLSFDIYIDAVDENGNSVPPVSMCTNGKIELTSGGNLGVEEIFCGTGSWMARFGEWHRRTIDLSEFALHNGGLNPCNLNYMRIYFTVDFGQEVQYRIKITNVYIVDLTKTRPSETEFPVGESVMTPLSEPNPTYYPAPEGFEDEKLVADYNLKEYVEKHAAALGTVTDYSPIIQGLLDKLSLAGGGTLYIPSGHYPCRTPISLRPCVTIYGDWKVPDGKSAASGTILDVYYGEGNLGGVPFISLSSTSMVKNLTFWYPEQNVNNIKKYSPTVSTTHWSWVKNCTFINSCMAVMQGPGFANCPNAQGIYGTPLFYGMNLGYTMDIMRIETVDFAADYWINSGLAGAPSSEADADRLRAHLYGNAVGVLVGRVDWSYLTYIAVDGYQVGVRFAKHASGVANGQCHGWDIRNCKIGLEVEALGTTGEMVANSTFDNCEIGVWYKYMQEPLTEGILHLINVDITATKYAVYHQHDAMLQLLSSHIRGGKVMASGGWYTLVNNEFTTEAPHVVLQAGTLSAVITGNVTANGDPITVQNVAKCPVQKSNEPADVAPIVTVTEEEGKEQKKGPASDKVYIIDDLDNSGKTDVTEALQQKLNAAAAAGGGVVHLTNGHYRLDGSIIIPTGVELRGSQDFGRIPYNGGAVLDIYDAEAEAAADGSSESESGVVEDPATHTHAHETVDFKGLVSKDDTYMTDAGFTEVKSAGGLVTATDFDQSTTVFHANFLGSCMKVYNTNWNWNFFTLDLTEFIAKYGVAVDVYIRAKQHTAWNNNHLAVGKGNGSLGQNEIYWGMGNTTTDKTMSTEWQWCKFSFDDVSNINDGKLKVSGTSEPHRPIYISDIVVCPREVAEEEKEPLTSDKAAIIMEEASGIRGLTMWYPKQCLSKNFATDHTLTKYPYTIQGRGSDIWIVNVSLQNSYKGVDLMSYRCDNHYVDYLGGVGINTSLQVGGGSKNGIIRNYQIKYGGFASETVSGWGGAKLPSGMQQIGYTYGQNNATILRVGDVDNLLLYDNFNYGGYQGVLFMAEESGAGDVRMYGCGMDYTTVCVDVQAVERLDILNLQMVSYNHAPLIGSATNLKRDMHFIRLGAANTGTVNVAGLNFWDSPTVCVEVKGGTLNLYGLNYFSGRAQFARLSQNGKVNVTAAYIKHNNVVLANQYPENVTVNAAFLYKIPEQIHDIASAEGVVACIYRWDFPSEQVTLPESTTILFTESFSNGFDFQTITQALSKGASVSARSNRLMLDLGTGTYAGVSGAFPVYSTETEDSLYRFETRVNVVSVPEDATFDANFTCTSGDAILPFRFTKDGIVTTDEAGETVKLCDYELGATKWYRVQVWLDLRTAGEKTYQVVVTNDDGEILAQSEAYPLPKDAQAAGERVYMYYVGAMDSTGESDASKGMRANIDYMFLSDDVQDPVLPEPPAEPEVLLGDVNGDEKIDSTDARMTLQYFVGSVGENDLDLVAADVDGNDKVDSTDARLILQYFVGSIDEFPAA